MEFDLDYDSEDEEHLSPSEKLHKQQQDMQDWIKQSRDMISQAAARATKGISSTSSKTGAHNTASQSKEDGVAATGTTTCNPETGTAPLEEILSQLEQWLTETYVEKREFLRNDMQPTLEALRKGDESTALDIETVTEEMEDLATALKEVFRQAQNLCSRLSEIQKHQQESQAAVQRAHGQLQATLEAESPPTPFTKTMSTGTRKKGNSRQSSSLSLSLDDLLAQVEQQNLKHEALQAMGGDRNSSTDNRSASTSASRVGENFGALFEQNNVKKATKDVKQFFSTFGSKVKAATSDVKKQFQKKTKTNTPPVSPRTDSSSPNEMLGLMARHNPTRTKSASMNYSTDKSRNILAAVRIVHCMYV